MLLCEIGAQRNQRRDHSIQPYSYVSNFVIGESAQRNKHIEQDIHIGQAASLLVVWLCMPDYTFLVAMPIRFQIFVSAHQSILAWEELCPIDSPHLPIG